MQIYYMNQKLEVSAKNINHRYAGRKVLQEAFCDFEIREIDGKETHARGGESFEGLGYVHLIS